MTVCILKPCEVCYNATQLYLAPGEYLTLPEKQAGKLINAGLARQTTPDDYRAVMTDFGKRDPGCRWDDIKQNHSELWERHIKAWRAGELGTAIKSFNEMLSYTPTQTRRSGNGIEI